jgi:hypothetical protein
MLTADSIVVAVTAASVIFEIQVNPGDVFRVASTTNAWICVATDRAIGTPLPPVAIKNQSGSEYLPANVPTIIAGPITGTVHVAIVRDTADGFASIARISG